MRNTCTQDVPPMTTTLIIVVAILVVVVAVVWRRLYMAQQMNRALMLSILNDAIADGHKDNPELQKMDAFVQQVMDSHNRNES
jgi:uncharacterized membrane protein YqiK